VPGRGMVVRLAESLQLPLRERNALLLSAGYAPVYTETALDAGTLRAVRDALGVVLKGHEPYPAMIVHRAGELQAANGACDIFFEGVAPELLEPPLNTRRVALHPAGMAPRVLNFEHWAPTSPRACGASAPATPIRPWRRCWPNWRSTCPGPGRGRTTSASPCRSSSAPAAGR
jgi:MmyB-like transcription regulator ligand binding domain